MNQFYMNGPSVGGAMSAEEFVSGAARAAGRLPDRSFAQRANDGPGAHQCPVCGQPCQPPMNGGGCGCNGGNVPNPAPPTGCDCGCNCGCDCGNVPNPMPPAGCDCCCGNMPNPMPPMGPDFPGSGGVQDPMYCQPMICCCRPGPGGVLPQPPMPPVVEEGCCCRQSFRAALGLLQEQEISSLVDFDLSAFVTDTYTAGAARTAITAPTPGTTPAAVDNLGTLAGSFLRFVPGSRDLLDIDAALYNGAGTAVNFTASQVSLCQLDAVAVQVVAGVAEGALTADEVTAQNFRRLRTLLAQRINPVGGFGPRGQRQGQGSCCCACDDEECCCASGLLCALVQNNLSRRVSLTAGLLVLANVDLLGAVGNVLVLANDENNRIYFVCVNSVEFIG